MQQIRPSGSFQILPPVIKNLIIINVLVFLAKLGLNRFGIDLDQMFGLYHWQSPNFRIWQPFTHLFMHFDFMHLFFNMFALWMMGNTVETYLGQKKFMVLYLVSGLGAAFCQLMVYNYHVMEYSKLLEIYPNNVEAYMGLHQYLSSPMIGASGAVFGVLFAFGYMFPNAMIYLYFAIPIRAKYFVAIYAALELFSGVRNAVGDNVAHFAHLGGMVFAFFILAYWKKTGKLYLR